MESPQNPTGSNLQWWQENTPTPRSKWYQETVSSESTAPVAASSQHAELDNAPAPVELWDELEAEAVRRVEQEQLRRSQEWVISVNSDKIVRTRTRRLTTLVGTVAALYALLAVVSHSWTPVYAIIFLVLFAVFVRQRMVKRLKKQRQLQIGMSPFGISFEGPNFDGVLDWKDIKSIERRKISGQRFMVFHTTDPAVIERFKYTAQGEKLRRVGRKWTWLARIQKLDMHAVYLPEDVLPMEPETFLARVATAQSAARLPVH